MPNKEKNNHKFLLICLFKRIFDYEKLMKISIDLCGQLVYYPCVKLTIVVNMFLRKVVLLQEILKNMDEVKRDRIINSAIDEFAKYPYAKASTNNIVENAGISKGLLFHYFGNKKDLYDKLSRFVFNKLSDEIKANIDWEQTDILERIKQHKTSFFY